jgi:hypothetical protein
MSSRIMEQKSHIRRAFLASNRACTCNGWQLAAGEPWFRARFPWHHAAGGAERWRARHLVLPRATLESLAPGFLLPSRSRRDNTPPSLVASITRRGSLWASQCETVSISHPNLPLFAFVPTWTGSESSSLSQQWQFWNALTACLRRRMSTASASSDNVQQRGCTAYGNVPLQQLSFQKMVARCSAMLYLTLRLRKASNSPDFPCRREDHPIVYRADLAYFMIRWRYGRDRIDQRGANPTRADEGCRADLVSEQHSAQQRTSRHPYRCLPEHHSV